jgi:hypothetical protein
MVFTAHLCFAVYLPSVLTHSVITVPATANERSFFSVRAVYQTIGCARLLSWGRRQSRLVSAERAGRGRHGHQSWQKGMPWTYTV